MEDKETDSIYKEYLSLMESVTGVIKNVYEITTLKMLYVGGLLLDFIALRIAILLAAAAMWISLSVVLIIELTLNEFPLLWLAMLIMFLNIIPIGISYWLIKKNKQLLKEILNRSMVP